MAQRSRTSPTVGLGWALAVGPRRWHDGVEDVLGHLPHGTRGYHVLSTVVRADVPTQAALAAYLSIDRTVMTYLIDALEADGLVERRPDPADRRARRVVATERGRTVLTDTERQVAAVERTVLGELDPAERAPFPEVTHR